MGDDSQSIYAFRGAKIENILNFKKDYPDCSLFRLEQNYRSTRTIVDAANSLIAKNTSRIPKTCYSEGEEGRKIQLLNAYTEQEEAYLISSSIVSEIQAEHAQYQDFAILYRTNSQSRALEDISGRFSYIMVDEYQDTNFAQYNILRKLSGLAALAAAASDKGCSLHAAGLAPGLETYGLKQAAISRIAAFCNMISAFNSKAVSGDAYPAASAIAMESGLLPALKEDTSIEGQSRLSNVEELLDSVSTFEEEKKNEYFEEMQADGTIEDGKGPEDCDLPAVTLSDYLENVSLLSAVDMTDDEDSTNRIALMTVHSSKGLEFPYVFVAGMEENLFPSGGLLASEADIEEERRLFYVAVTRAEKAVWLSFAATRMRNGKHESNSPSRFIREIDSRYIMNPLPPKSSMSERYAEPASDESWARHARTEKRLSGVSSSRNTVSSAHKPAPVSRPVPKRVPDVDFIPTPVLELCEGQRVEHNRFGYGTIVAISGDKSSLKAKISFDDYGEKILMLNYAKIRRI